MASPVLVIVISYVTTSPARPTRVVSDVLATVNAASGTVTVSVAVVTLSTVALATFVTCFAVTSPARTV